MTSSNKKKRERAAQAFKKTKLKVGKTPNKPANHTDTSFRSKTIVVTQQSLSVRIAPETEKQFLHHLSLLNHHASQTRKDSLAFLTTHFRDVSVSPATLLPKLAPLILDESNGVRTALLAFFALLKPNEVRLQLQIILLHVWSAMSHIDTDIRRDSTKFLSWALSSAKEDVLGNGGWAKGLTALASVLEGKHLEVIQKFLVAGFGEEEEEVQTERVLHGGLHWSVQINLTRAGVQDYRYLGLFAGEVGAVEDAPGRRRWCVETAQGKQITQRLKTGLVGLTKEGGETGRVAGKVLQILERGIERAKEME
ncbi:putative rRNA processing protein Ipi1 [Pyronema omphalodes]|nr:putative rRNA processing protein Ipi1 [Pyronema omphalodes]